MLHVPKLFWNPPLIALWPYVTSPCMSQNFFLPSHGFSYIVSHLNFQNRLAVQRLETSESPHYHDGRQEIGKYPKNFVEQRASESSVTETVTEKNFNPILIGESRIQIPFCVTPRTKTFWIPRPWCYVPTF